MADMLALFQQQAFEKMSDNTKQDQAIKETESTNITEAQNKGTPSQRIEEEPKEGHEGGSEIVAEPLVTKKDDPKNDNDNH